MDSSRQKIVNSPAKVRLIEGAPGVGKTWFGCELAQYELDHPELGVQLYQKILFLTFARNAVARIRQVFTQQADDKKASAFVERVRMDTFCGFFWWLGECYGRYGQGGTTKRLWLIGSKDIPGAPIPEGHEGLTFDKIEACALELVRVSAVRRLISDIYPLIIVDEFQDVHDRLFEIIEALGRSTRLVLLRGPGQCIYRGLPGKAFDPIRVRQKCIMRLGAAIFTLSSLGEEKQRYCPDIKALICQFDTGTVQPPAGWPIDFELVPRQNSKGNPNELETFAAKRLREMRKALSEPGSRFAVLVSTNLGAAAVKRRLDRGSDAHRLYPQSSSLTFGDNTLLHYGRLALRLLRGHWIAGPAKYVKPDEVAALLALLFHEQRANAYEPPSSWTELANVLLQTAHRQREPKERSCWRESLKTNLSRLNDLLRATKEKQREKGIESPHSTPFDRGDIPLLETLTDEFIASIEKNVDADGKLHIKKAEVAFERASQQRVIYEKLGMQKNVQVMTIHKSKGREFDGVVLVLEDPLKAVWRRTSKATDEEIEDLYRVAISRARSAFALVAFEDAWTDAAPPVRRLLPEGIFRRDS